MRTIFNTPFRISNAEKVSPLSLETPPNLGVSNKKWCKHDYFKEQIVLLYYNLTRKDNDNNNNKNNNINDIPALSLLLDNILYSLKKSIHKSSKQYLQYLVLLYKMIGHTRDCFYGKGEQTLSYMMIAVLYKYYPVLSIYVLHKFVQPLSNGELGYGSWRDIKYFCEYLRCNSVASIHHPLIPYCIRLMNNALKKDYDTWNDVLDNHFQKIIRSSSFSSLETLSKPIAREHLSSVSKWIPREYKKMDWMHEMLVLDWFKNYKPYILSSHTCVASYYNAINKCKLIYRKMVSKLNKVLDTTEIKVCSNNLDSIIPKHIPQIMFMKNKNKLWYSNISCDTNPSLTFFTNNDKIMKQKCAQSFQHHFENKYYLLSPFQPNRLHNKNIPMDVPISFFIKEAYFLYKMQVSQSSGSFQCCESSQSSQNVQLKIDILNQQWKQLSSILDYEILKDFIPLIDISFDIDKYSDAFFSSIGLAFLISCRSSLGKRMIVIDHHPTWINLEKCNDLFSMISTFFDSIISNSNTNYNVFEAFEMIIQCMDETKMSYRKIENVSLVLFHHHNLSCNFHSLITDLFHLKGLKSSRGKPFPTPRIFYWNISNSVCSLPFHLDRQKNAFVLSGYSSSLIRSLYLFRSNKTQPKDTFDFVTNILNSSRYDDLEKYIFTLIA